MKTHVLTGNLGGLYEVISDLKIGDIVKCIKGKRGLCDGGTTLVFEDSILTEGKLYPVKYVCVWDGKSAPYVMNDDGALTWVESEYFTTV